MDALRRWALPLLCGGVLMGLALGVRHVQGLFLLPIAFDRGWGRESVALALAAQNLIWGLAQPFAGMVADRWGSRRVLFGGALLYALGLATMAGAQSLWQLYLGAGLLIGVGLAGTAFGVVYGALSRQVSASARATVLGLTGAVGGLGQFLAVPLTQGLLQSLGWAQALLCLAALFLLVLPLAWPLNDRQDNTQPADAAGAAGGSMGAAIRAALAERSFWLLNLGFLACGFQLAFIATHLPAYLLEQGLPAGVAARALALIALSNIAGTYACGWLGGRYAKKRLLSAIYLLRTAAMALFLLAPPSGLSVQLFCAAMGLLWLGTLPLTNGLVGQLFGLRYVSTLFGFTFVGHQLGAFLGVWLGGRLFDATHSYQLMWWLAMALGIVAALLHWPIDERPSPAARLGLAT
ncbi:MFS transporter [Paucibacter sp. APW11]|uniref:MFS transporter n=1 Tax=Roseateles aquae TaxID=3077235 RepID=A0ABU3PE61_9BURK|nr:MFS transporter [Paucibacter sp. APW11]MDT9000412.1 MFS transporter [Paucibacter sp. APW11]